MQKTNKSKTIAIAIALLMMTSVIMIDFAVQPAKAQLATNQPYSGPLKAGDVADGTFDTTIWISIRPKLVGIDQTVLVNAWATPASNAGRKLMGYHITITKPDGTKDEFTQNSERDTAATWLEYIPDQIGEYKYKVDFPGTFCPAGIYNDGVIYTSTAAAGAGYQGVPTVYTGSTYYKPDSSPEYTFTVQQEMVWSWSAAGVPTDYWTRPVAVEHREWISIIGDWPWYGPGTNDFSQLYPNTSPILEPTHRLLSLRPRTKLLTHRMETSARKCRNHRFRQRRYIRSRRLELRSPSFNNFVITWCHHDGNWRTRLHNRSTSTFRTDQWKYAASCNNRTTMP